MTKQGLSKYAKKNQLIILKINLTIILTTKNFLKIQFKQYTTTQSL